MRGSVAVVCCLALAVLMSRNAEAARGLRGGQCLDPAQARSWIADDDDRLLVDAGRYKYRIQVASACTALGYSHTIAFRGDPIGGRVCGGLGDAIITRDYSCRIERMELLSKEQFKAALQQRDLDRKARKIMRKSTAP